MPVVPVIPIPVQPVIPIPIKVPIPELTGIMSSLKSIDELILKERKKTPVPGPTQKQIQAVVNREVAHIRASRPIINSLGTLL